jgi:hypothetical protein
VLCCWAKGYQGPLYLISNMATAEEACHAVSANLLYGFGHVNLQNATTS